MGQLTETRLWVYYNWSPFYHSLRPVHVGTWKKCVCVFVNTCMQASGRGQVHRTWLTCPQKKKKPLQYLYFELVAFASKPVQPPESVGCQLRMCCWIQTWSRHSRDFKPCVFTEIKIKAVAQFNWGDVGRTDLTITYRCVGCCMYT